MEEGRNKECVGERHIIELDIEPITGNRKMIKREREKDAAIDMERRERERKKVIPNGEMQLLILEGIREG